jgi:antitoxin component YwqK of YwqJK toxin-antitoxin module
MKHNEFVNGQKMVEQKGDQLTYFFKNGKVKADGISKLGMMEGEWMFYRETGQLWQVGNFKNGQKHGSWVRYDKTNNVEYEESFFEGKMVKK